MPARILDGKALAAALREELAGRVASLGYRPCLTVVLAA